MGFTPTILHDLLEQGSTALQQIQESGSDQPVSLVVRPAQEDESPFKIVYEVTGNVGHLEPRLRVSVVGQADPDRLVVSAFSSLQTEVNSTTAIEFDTCWNFCTK